MKYQSFNKGRFNNANLFKFGVNHTIFEATITKQFAKPLIN